MTDLTPTHTVEIAVGSHQGEKTWRNWTGSVEDFAAQLFQEHQVGPKDGKCITQGPLVDARRIANDVARQTIIMGDVDNGTSGDELQAKLEEAELAAILWTTHSHMKGETEIGQTALDNFMEETGLTDLEEAAKKYLAAKKGVVAEIAETVSAVVLKHKSGGAKYIVSHAPMPRWRVLCFLAEPFVFVTEDAPQKDRINEWKRRYIGFAEKLGLTIDEKCKDPSRLMFTPRRAADSPAALHEIRFIEGRLVTLDDMPFNLTAKEKEVAARKEVNALLDHGSAAPAQTTAAAAATVRQSGDFVTKNLKLFLARAGKGFLAKDWYASVSDPRRIVDDAKTEFECPYDEMHGNAGDVNDKAFFATNAEPLSEPPVPWTMYCGHATCTGHTGGDRAKYLDKALQDAGVTDAMGLMEWVDPGYAAEIASNPNFTLTQQGNPKPGDPHNVLEVMRVEGVLAEYDAFLGKATVTGLGNFSGIANDDAALRLRFKCRYPYDFWPNNDALWGAIRQAALDRSNDPLKAYIANLPPWDGKARIEKVLIDYAGAEDTEINREFTRTFFMGAVARAILPGCQFDYVLVLEGPQGIGKSTFLRTIVPNEDWFGDNASVRDDTKVILEKTAGKWIVELAEFSGMKFAEIEHVKATLTRRVDAARMAYDRVATERPRRFVFAVTTNKQDYLRDTTGNRRFMPVWCSTEFDHDAIAAERDQYYAEALYYLEQKHLPMVRPEFWEAALEAQGARLEENEYASRLEPIFGLKAGAAPVADVYEHLQMGQSGNGLQFQQKRVAECMEALGWHKKKSNGIRQFVRVPAGWVPSPEKGRWVSPEGARVVLPKLERGAVGWIGGVAVDTSGRLAGPLPVEQDAPEPAAESGPPKAKGLSKL